MIFLSYVKRVKRGNPCAFREFELSPIYFILLVFPPGLKIVSGHPSFLTIFLIKTKWPQLKFNKKKKKSTKEMKKGGKGKRKGLRGPPPPPSPFLLISFPLLLPLPIRSLHLSPAIRPLQLIPSQNPNPRKRNPNPSNTPPSRTCSGDRGYIVFDCSPNCQILESKKSDSESKWGFSCCLGFERYVMSTCPQQRRVVEGFGFRCYQSMGVHCGGFGLCWVSDGYFFGGLMGFVVGEDKSFVVGEDKVSWSKRWWKMTERW